MCSFIGKHRHNLRFLLSGLNRRGASAHPGPGAARAPTARGFLGDRSGVVVILVALTMPVLAGTMGLAAETSYWYVHRRGMQNAADAAALAAATNAGSGYVAEAKAVAARFGFTHGSGNITVAATNPSSATGCTTPAGSANSCYVVTVLDKVPLFLSRVLTGKTGTTTLAVSSVASNGAAYPYCVLALAPTPPGEDPAIRTNGAPKADLSGCKIKSNSGATCNGSNLNASVGDAKGTNSGCGIQQNSNMPGTSDPYESLKSNIPADTCGGTYPQETGKKSKTVPISNQWSGSYSLSGYKIVCGDQKLTGNTTISAPSNAVLVIYNGVLDTNGFTFKTTSGSGLTVVFTAPPADYADSKYQHVPVDDTNSGTLDIAAPTSGTWHGMAIYQDPNLVNSPPGGTGNLDISYAGNNPTWNITGMVYLPHSSVEFSGAVNKATNGLSCFGLTVGDLLINGTANMISNTQCVAAGVDLPQGGNRGTLVN
ncbi:MAG: pilus assembly protein TadG-related protein [Beijerinckiaceae bacterium]